jgi:hypothetical protein
LANNSVHLTASPAFIGIFVFAGVLVSAALLAAQRNSLRQAAADRTLKGRRLTLLKKWRFSLTSMSAWIHSQYAAIKASAGFNPSDSYFTPSSKGISVSSSIVILSWIVLISPLNTLDGRFLLISLMMVLGMWIVFLGIDLRSFSRRSSEEWPRTNPTADKNSLVSKTSRNLFFPELFSDPAHFTNGLFFGESLKRIWRVFRNFAEPLKLFFNAFAFRIHHVFPVNLNITSLHDTVKRIAKPSRFRLHGVGMNAERAAGAAAVEFPKVASSFFIDPASAFSSQVFIAAAVARVFFVFRGLRRWVRSIFPLAGGTDQPSIISGVAGDDGIDRVQTRVTRRGQLREHLRQQTFYVSPLSFRSGQIIIPIIIKTIREQTTKIRTTILALKNSVAKRAARIILAKSNDVFEIAKRRSAWKNSFIIQTVTYFWRSVNSKTGVPLAVKQRQGPSQGRFFYQRAARAAAAVSSLETAADTYHMSLPLAVVVLFVLGVAYFVVLSRRDARRENRKTIVVALGGNAMDDLLKMVKVIADLIQSGYRVVIAHGNGPQVGAALMRK